MSTSRRYQCPKTIAQACEAIQANPQAKFIAGGQSILPTMRLGLAMFDEIIDLHALRLTELGQITRTQHPSPTLTLGAMTTHAQIAQDAQVQAFSPMLSQLAAGIGDAQVRNMGTVAGSLANNDPSACWPAGVLACGGFITAQSVSGQRTIDIDDFFMGLYTTALAPDEMITHITLNKPQAATYLKFEQPASRFALVGVAIAQFESMVRIAITGLGHGVMRWPAAQDALSKRFDVQALQDITLDPCDATQDIHASAVYRVHLAKVLCERAVQSNLSV